MPRPWKCEACGNDITNGELIIYNANAELGPVGCYPINASPDFPPDAFSDAKRVAADRDVATRQEKVHYEVEAARWGLNRPINISFGAYCFGCNPYADLGPYSMPTTGRAEDWMAWVTHVHEKTWMGAEDLWRMIYYWFNNRGLRPGDFL